MYLEVRILKKGRAQSVLVAMDNKYGKLRANYHQNACRCSTYWNGQLSLVCWLHLTFSTTSLNIGHFEGVRKEKQKEDYAAFRWWSYVSTFTWRNEWNTFQHTTTTIKESKNSVGAIVRALGFLFLFLIHSSCFTGNSVTGLPAQTFVIYL